MPFSVAGKPVPFEMLAQNTGVIILETGKDDQIITALDAAAKANRGGIIALADEQEYESKKKTRPPLLATSAPKPQQPKLRVMQTLPRKPHQPNQNEKVGAEVVVAEDGKKISPEVGGTGSGDNGGGDKPAGTSSPPFVPKTQKRSEKAGKTELPPDKENE